MLEMITIKSDRVILRCYGGLGLVRLAVGHGLYKTGPKVYVTNDLSLRVVGWPAEDVFEYNEEAAANLDTVDWAALKRWQPPTGEQPAESEGE